jgi:KDO2-lipid IV(A) lauroyltransferase
MNHPAIKKTKATAIILACFRTLPLPFRRWLFTGMFNLFYYLSAKHRLIALHNLARAFPEKPMSELKQIARGVYRSLGLVAAEFFEIPSLTKENIRQYIEVEGLDYCTEALKKNKGMLIFGAHFGNWELSAAATALLLKPMMVIYRRLDSAVLENLVAWSRSVTGNIPLEKDFAMRPMLRHLKENGIIALLIDQNVAWQEGVFVNYFGRLACTTNGLAILALHTGAPVIPAAAVRQKDGTYKLIFGKEIELIRTGDRNEEELGNTQLFMKVIEDTVRQYPDQWLWIHQRWKTKTCQVKTIK